MSRSRARRIPVALSALTTLALTLGGALFWRSTAQANRTALADSPKPVTVQASEASEYRASRRYIGTVEPWLEARIGPQVTAAYVDTMLVRPGARVKRGEVVATLDCREATAASAAIAMQARALDAQQQAAAHEAARISSLLAGGFVSENEAEQKTAETASKQAELLALKAQWTRASVGVGDCVLRAPFEGEISERLADPGVFARPGTPVAVIVDRSMVRITADVPESDFDVVPPGTPVTVRDFATGAKVASTVARRAPSADASTRTIHIELDVPNPDRTLPVRTTAELGIDVGAPVTTTKVPLASASVRGTRASLFVVDGNVAHKVVASVVGERNGTLFLDGTLKPGALVVAEGRSTLKDGDRVLAQLDRPASSAEERAAAHP